MEEEALKAAVKRIKKDKDSAATRNIVIICACALLCVCIICCTILVVCTIDAQREIMQEQQYALNMQYAGLLDYINGAEITTTTETWEASADGDSISVAGNSNTIAGGDMIGIESESHKDSEES